MAKVRTRFAPSPTGALHAGTVRTALFAWLLARQNRGDFILRIEDTDQKRSSQESIDNIIESLNYIGISWDEGPGKDGKFGPYYQSKRLDIYKEWANKLIGEGRAYADPYSEAQLKELREKSKAENKPFLFRNHRPTDPGNWAEGQPLRFKSDPKPYQWNDLVMGAMHAGAEAIDDFIIIKSDGFPTYNFAHIVDDILMEITHVIRSQEFIASVPNYLNLYDALGVPSPLLAIVPPVMSVGGKKKLSKREGAKQMLEYKAMGILSEALINYLVTLGWNDGTEQEIFSLDEIIDKFDIARVQKSGAQFDEQKLIYINGHYIRNALSLDDLYQIATDYWPPSAKEREPSYLKDVLALVKERLKYLSELTNLTEFFFTDLPVNLSLITDNKKLKLEKHELVSLLKQSRSALLESDYSEADLSQRLNQLLETTGQKPAVLFSLIRIATTQAPASPGLAETLALLGKETSLRRIDATLEAINEDL